MPSGTHAPQFDNCLGSPMDHSRVSDTQNYLSQAPGVSATCASRSAYRVPKKAGRERMADRRDAQSATGTAVSTMNPTHGRESGGPTSKIGHSAYSMVEYLRTMMGDALSALKIDEEDSLIPCATEFDDRYHFYNNQDEKERRYEGRAMRPATESDKEKKTGKGTFNENEKGA